MTGKSRGYAQRVKTLQVIKSTKDVMSFGKHRTKTVSQVLSYAPDYLEWAINEKVIEVSEEISVLIQEAMSYPGLYRRNKGR